MQKIGYYTEIYHITHFLVELFSQNLESLLRHIGEIVDKHTDSEVLENCSKVMEVLCNEDYAISSKCNIAKSALIDSLVHKYMQAFKDFFSGVSNVVNVYVIQALICFRFVQIATIFKSDI